MRLLHQPRHEPAEAGIIISLNSGSSTNAGSVSASPLSIDLVHLLHLSLVLPRPSVTTVTACLTAWHEDRQGKHPNEAPPEL